VYVPLVSKQAAVASFLDDIIGCHCCGQEDATEETSQVICHRRAAIRLTYN